MKRNNEERDLAITFAGGGNRAFYQLGLWNQWGAQLLPRIAGVSACSAGGCVITLILSGRYRESNLFWAERCRTMKPNFDWSRLLAGEAPARHGAVYHETLVFAFRDGGLERIRAQPFPILILATTIPARLHPIAAAVIGVSAYQIEKALRRGMMHPMFGRALGFAPAVFDARDCETPEQLADLILSSSATPPFTPVGSYRGLPLLDGGVIDNAPASIGDSITGVRKNLVLLTRPYPKSVLGRMGPRLYVAPTQPVPVESWDFSRPHLIDDTIAMGEREAGHHDASLQSFLS